MTQGPEDPQIPILTQVVKPAARPRTQDSTPPQPVEPVVPSPGTLPPDLDIDLSLEALDEPTRKAPEQALSISLIPPGFMEVLQPPATARPAAPEPDAGDLRAQVEAAVEQALAAQIPALRERLVDAVLNALSPSGNASREDPPGS